MKNVRGNMPLYALVMVPVALTLCVAAIDLSHWGEERDELQREADRIASSAAQLLPDTAEALRFITSSVSSLPGVSLVTDNQVDSESLVPANGIVNYSATPLIVNSSVIKITLQRIHRAAFDAFVGPQHFSAVKSSTVQVIPSDTILIINDGHTLRPSLAAPWGDRTEWPASDYFRCVALPKSGEVYGNPGVDYRSEGFQRAATQSCYNAAFSAIKLTAINLVDTLSSHSLNRIGVIYTPGRVGERPFAVQRHLRGAAVYEGVPILPDVIGGFFDRDSSRSEAYWNDIRYVEDGSGLGDEACALFSILDNGAHPAFNLADPIAPFIGASSKFEGDILSFSPCGKFHRPYNLINKDFITTALSLRQAIFWHAAKAPSLGFLAEADFVAALRQAYFEFENIANPLILGFDKSVRGNLAFNPYKQIIVLTDLLPPSSPELVELLALFQQADIKIRFVSLKHAGLTPEQQEGIDLNTITLRGLDPAARYLRVYVTQDPEELSTKVSPELGRLGRSLAVRS